ncbi:MAG: c-type cytochrome [Chloroflexi bacterium]|nr:c-type cytochrome [Chloroflexota bacterium]
MNIRYRLPVALALVAVLALLAAPALAGGWAVVTLDSLPAYAVANQPLTVSFMIRQHGQTPWQFDRVQVEAARQGGGATLSFDARQDGAKGHYSAVLTFPSDGTWSWGVESGLYPDRQPMPPLTVLASAPDGTANTPAPAGGAINLPTAVGLAGLVVSAGGLLALAHTRRPWAAVLLLIALTVSGVGFASAAGVSVAEPKARMLPAPTGLMLGQQLFVAKGCVVCHVHDAAKDVKRQFDFTLDGAPVLTNYKGSPDFLAKWLDNPAAIKPGTEMPTLGLSDEENGALVAFLTSGR